MTTTLATLPPDTFLADLFPPPDPSILEGIFSEYAADKTALISVGNALSRSDLLEHFFDSEKYSRYQLRDLDGAIKSLDARYWGRVFKVSQIEEYMPAARVYEWHEQIQALNTPRFDPPAVAATLTDLFSSRLRFFAERVDGVFQALSPQHLTNCPNGFGKRMIIQNVGWRYEREINDLRTVIAMMLGREAPEYQDTDHLLKCARRQYGKWLSVDDGAMQIRIYKKGTAHIQVDPEIAWRLNAMLAYLHPKAIPAEHRRRPAKKRGTPARLFSRPIPREVLRRLHELTFDRESVVWKPYYGRRDPIQREAERILAALGFVVDGNGRATLKGVEWPETEEIINALVSSGMVPDKKAHEFYPTPEDIAARMVECLALEPDMNILEPCAGQGHLALALPPDSDVTAIEIDPVFAEVLRARTPSSWVVECADFMKWRPTEKFDRILMNPPFSCYDAFLFRAARHLRIAGLIVALLPASAMNKRLYIGEFGDMEWSEPFEFPGVSVKVVILTFELTREVY